MTGRALFGSRLRHARERRKLTLDHLADRTKISASLISALEDGTCARWPGGVYSRSYVRSYAELVGLDPAETVDEFASLFPHLAFLEIEQAARAEIAGRAARRGMRATGAPLRLFLEEEPAPWWRLVLTRLACWLHRVASGGAPRPERDETPATWSPAADETSPFATLQVDP